MMSLREELAAICARSGPALGASRPEVAAVLARLEEPAPRLAVAGRLKAGKSTLVNALLGQRLAPTGVTECTMMVTWYRYHPYNRVEVHLRDGSKPLIPAADDGGLPATLGYPAGDVVRVVLEADNSRLRDRHVIIDTPGLDSLSHLDEGSLAAIAEADALLYVMPLPTANDQHVLTTVIRDALAGSRMSAANVIGVLSRIDELGSGGTPWETAPAIAESYARSLRGLVGTVIPLLGKLAEAVTAGHYTDADTRALRALADAGPAAARNMRFAGWFLDWADAPVGESSRKRLLEMLGMYGISEAIAVIQAGQRTTHEILEHLRRQSGLDVLLGAIQDNVTRQADRLRADIALSRLERATAGSDQRLTAELREFRKKPAMRQAALVDALIELNRGDYSFDDDDDAAALIALATGGDPASQLQLPPGASPGEIAERAGKEIERRWHGLTDPHNHNKTLQYHAHSARELCDSLRLAAREEAARDGGPA
jgi:Dynamin family